MELARECERFCVLFVYLCICLFVCLFVCVLCVCVCTDASALTRVCMYGGVVNDSVLRLLIEACAFNQRQRYFTDCIFSLFHFSFEARRIIIREGHMADNFYLILSGTG